MPFGREINRQKNESRRKGKKVQAVRNKSNEVRNQKLVGSTGKLKCFYVNARSIVNKRSELELYVCDEKPDIVGITESWGIENISDSEFDIEGYTLIRKDRILGSKLKGGGVMLYVKNCLNAIVREDFEDNNFQESIWCDIEIGGEKTLIAVCYRPPDSDKIQDEALYKLLIKAGKEKILIMGDFNYPELKWDHAVIGDASHPFFKCVNDNFLIQCVENSTRGKNVLDLVFTSEENMVEDLIVGEPFVSSDHQIIRWNFIACKENDDPSTEKIRLDYFRADYDKLRAEAKIRKWDNIISGSNVQLDWSRFKETLEDLRDKGIPLKKHKNGKCKWVNRAVIKSRRAKNKAWIKYKKTNLPEDLCNYKKKLG